MIYMDVWVKRCAELGNTKKGKISIGGMVSVLVQGLDVPILLNQEGDPILTPIRGSFVYNIKGLANNEMLLKDESRNPNYHVWK